MTDRHAAPPAPPASPWPRRSADLLFRVPTEDDVAPLLAWRNDPRVGYWLIRTRADEASMRTSLRGPRDPDDFSAVAVHDGEVVAAAYLSVSDGMGQDVGTGHVRAEGLLGWNVAPGCWGRGFATQIARTLLEVAFDELRLHRVTAGCFADNTASWRVMERVGMRREQHGVKDSWHADLGWVDGYTYAMLREEWQDGLSARRGGRCRPAP
ncbi:GNAT family N-acetyltransferase [Oryzobacter sp. R7]|uniref:GNAT family N-acetyltransferase n=1 Tax=Oryzobacter faecalis TaxID=3388656 RepID=UPI00398D5C5E